MEFNQAAAFTLRYIYINTLYGLGIYTNRLGGSVRTEGKGDICDILYEFLDINFIVGYVAHPPIYPLFCSHLPLRFAYITFGMVQICDIWFL